MSLQFKLSQAPVCKGSVRVKVSRQARCSKPTIVNRATRVVSCKAEANDEASVEALKRQAGVQQIEAMFDLDAVKNEEGFFTALEAVAKKVNSTKILPLWRDFYASYKKAILGSNKPGYDEKLVLKIQCDIAKKSLGQFIDPYTFPSQHTRLREPYDYYMYGQRYVQTLIDFDNSVLGHVDKWNEVAKQIADGHNVVLLANHQTEADPGVFAHMLQHTHPQLAENVIYVAGDRVVTDPLVKPFSMGRNLYCIFSKRHMDDEPELKQMKQDTNRKTLSVMSKGLKEGGKLLWIAPGGGRDRQNDDDIYVPAKFDPSAVALMDTLLNKAKNPGHLYPMAMYTWPVMPPPKTVQSDIGEQRIIGHKGVGISLGTAIDSKALAEQWGDISKQEKQIKLSDHCYKAVSDVYFELEQAIADPSARSSFAWASQPWAKKMAETSA